MSQNTLNPIDRSTLRDLIASHFSDEELQALCMDLDIDYESIPGQTKSGKALGIIEYLQHRHRLQDVVDRASALRPLVDWNAVYEPEVTPHPGTTPAKAGQNSSRRWWIGGVGLILILLLAGGLFYARSGRLCTYHGAGDYDTITQIIKAESQATNNGNLEIITDIFAPDAYLKQTTNGVVTEWFDPLSRYGPMFENSKFFGALHTEIDGRVENNYARFTSGSLGNYITNGSYGEYNNKAGNPAEEEVWTLNKNFWGCWYITRFEFH